MGSRTFDQAVQAFVWSGDGNFYLTDRYLIGMEGPWCLIHGLVSVHLLRSRETVSACPLSHRDGATDGPTLYSAAMFSQLVQSPASRKVSPM